MLQFSEGQRYKNERFFFRSISSAFTPSKSHISVLFCPMQLLTARTVVHCARTLSFSELIAVIIVCFSDEALKESGVKWF